MNLYPSRSAGLLSWVTVLLTPFFIILSSLYIFMSPQFIQYEYSQPNFPPAERFTAEARTFNATETVRYVLGQRSLTDLTNLDVYNEREIKHLVDVEKVAHAALQFHALSGILIALALVALARKPLTRAWAARSLVSGGMLTLAVIAAIGIFSVVAFDQFFVTFHHIFFEGDSWLFPTTDSLIQFYPEVFWEAASYGIALFVAGTALLVAAIGWRWQRSLATNNSRQARALMSSRV